MTNFYRFPAMAKLDEIKRSDQFEKIKEEFYEVKEAYYSLCMLGMFNQGKAKYQIEYGMELMDVIHATETALRIEFTDQEIDELQRLVIAKNDERGYYDD